MKPGRLARWATPKPDPTRSSLFLQTLLDCITWGILRSPPRAPAPDHFVSEVATVRHSNLDHAAFVSVDFDDFDVYGFAEAHQPECDFRFHTPDLIHLGRIDAPHPHHDLADQTFVN